MAGNDRHPILVDTDAFIAAANTDLWDQIVEHIALSTTNVVKAELERHKEETHSSAPEGSRPRRLHEGSSNALTALADDDVPFTIVSSVPRPHGPDAGEQSLRQEFNQHPNETEVILLMDADGRRNIRRDIERNELNAQVLPPTFLFYILLDNDLIDERQFCETTEEMLLNEGWTGYQAVQAAWGGIPVDCSAYVDSGVLP